MSNFNSKMSENLLKTLDAIQARDELSQENTKSFEDNIDKDTGEWLGEAPEGYKPFEAPNIEVKDIPTKVQEFENSDARTDYMRVRETTYAIQEATMFMLQQSAQLAANTEAPRAFSVFRELGELMRGLNKDLMENQKNFKSATQGDEPVQPEGDTEISVQTDGNGGTRVTVGKSTTRRSSRDLMEVARQLQAEQEAKRKQEAQQKLDAEAVEGEIVEEGKPNADDAPTATSEED